VADYSEYFFGILMVSVVAPFVVNPKEDQKAAGHTNGQPGDIDEGITLVTAYVTKGGDDIVAYHDKFS
jgi:hypothetical protein